MTLDDYQDALHPQRAGYRLQLTLTDLADLALQIQHVRWNIGGDGSARANLDDFEALCRAAADSVAARMREIGVPPDGRVATTHHDLLFDSLPVGPFSPSEGQVALLRRVAQMGERVRESLEILRDSDPDSATILLSISDEIAGWKPPTP